MRNNSILNRNINKEIITLLTTVMCSVIEFNHDYEYYSFSCRISRVSKLYWKVNICARRIRKGYVYNNIRFSSHAVKIFVEWYDY